MQDKQIIAFMEWVNEFSGLLLEDWTGGDGLENYPITVILDTLEESKTNRNKIEILHSYNPFHVRIARLAKLRKNLSEQIGELQGSKGDGKEEIV